MRHVIEFLALLARLVRPARGLHAAPRALRDGPPPRRAARVRRYASDLPTIAKTTRDSNRGNSPGPLIPAPRPPLDAVPAALVPLSRNRPSGWAPIVQPAAVNPPADIVRNYYRAHEVRMRRRSGPSPHARLEPISVTRMAS